MSNSIVLGVDIGGSHITTALIDQQNGALLQGSWHRERINSHAGADEIIHSWSKVMKLSLEAAPGVYRAGIAMPGPLIMKPVFRSSMACINTTPFMGST